MEVDVKTERCDVIQYTSPLAVWFIDKSRDTAISPTQQQIWLLCGLTLYPKHSALRLQLYRWYLHHATSQAAEQFSLLVKEFPNDPVVIEHLTGLIGLINSGSENSEIEVLKSLSQAEQQDVYLAVATSQHDKLTCTSTVLQMMRAHPSSIAQHAISAATLLIKDEQQQGFSTPVNPLRKMLILELMPLILSKGNEFLNTLTDTVVKLFVDLVAHYYIECASVTDPAVKEEYKITDPWADLRSTLVDFAKLHAWIMVPGYEGFGGSAQFIQQATEKCLATEPSGPGIFYCILFTMLEYTFKYIKCVDTYSLILVKSRDKPTTNQSFTLPLHEEEEPLRKRRRTLSLTECSSNVINCFKIATTCHKFLKTYMEDELVHVCSEQELNSSSWRWYSLFLTDMAVWEDDEGLHAIQQKHYKEYESDQFRVVTQQALGSTGPSNTFRSLWTLLEKMPSTADPSLHTSLDIVISNPDINQNFSFVVNTRSKLCLHICRTLVNMVKERISRTKQADILALLLIIYQYDISRFQEELALTISAIKSTKTFKYKGLLEFVSEVDILEELLHLVVNNDVRLDILDTKKRYNKDEVVSSVTAHVQHCTDNSEDLVMRFIVDHKEDIEAKFSQFAFSSTF